MGALISNLKGGNNDTIPDIPLNIEESKVGTKEKDIFSDVSKLQVSMQDILILIKAYKGCSEEIREAISHPSEETNTKVWEALQPSITSSVKMYQFGNLLAVFCKRILDFYCNEGNIPQTIQTNPGLTRLLIKTFCFILDFDELKTRNSDIQNDFSYYRRSVNKFKMDTGSNQYQALMTDEEANFMSLFFAHHTPMFKSLSQSLSDYLKQNSDNSSNFFSFLAYLSGASYHGLTKSRFTTIDSQEALLRTMVTTTVLYDALHPEGVFVKASQIDARTIIRTVNMTDSPIKATLLNNMRFNFTHLNDKTTPKQIKILLNVN